MKKLAAFLCCTALGLCMAAPVYADDGASVTITDGGVGGGEAIVATTQGGTQPVSVTSETVNGVQYITKVYEMPAGAEVDALAAAFEQDGHSFTCIDTKVREQPGTTDSKTATETTTAAVDSDSVAEAMKAAAPTIPYSEDGYTGTLALDASAVTVQAEGSESYTYRVTDVREYDNLDRNDAAYVPKTVLKNGVTLNLENMEWVVMGSYPVDGRMVPNLFKAVVSYAGTATGTRPTGYTATYIYTGTVQRVVPGSSLYTLVFRGEPIAAAEADKGENAATSDPGEAAPGESGGSGKLFLLVFLSLACIAVAGYTVFSFLRRRRKASGGYDEYDEYGAFEESADGGEQITRFDEDYLDGLDSGDENGQHEDDFYFPSGQNESVRGRVDGWADSGDYFNMEDFGFDKKG